MEASMLPGQLGLWAAWLRHTLTWGRARGGGWAGPQDGGLPGDPEGGRLGCGRGRDPHLRPPAPAPGLASPSGSAELL